MQTSPTTARERASRFSIATRSYARNAQSIDRSRPSLLPIHHPRVYTARVSVCNSIIGIARCGISKTYFAYDLSGGEGGGGSWKRGFIAAIKSSREERHSFKGTARPRPLLIKISHAGSFYVVRSRRYIYAEKRIRASSRILLEITARCCRKSSNEPVTHPRYNFFYRFQHPTIYLRRSMCSFERCPFLPMALFRFIRETLAQKRTRMQIFMKITLRKYMAKKEVDQFFIDVARGIVRSIRCEICAKLVINGV